MSKYTRVQVKIYQSIYVSISLQMHVHLLLLIYDMTRQSIKHRCVVI